MTTGSASSAPTATANRRWPSSSPGGWRRLHKLEIAYFAQHQLDELNPSLSAYDHVRALMSGATEAQVRARTGSMGLAMSKMNTPAGDLSGGEKARLLLGLATFAGPHLMILDEPTNHLDIDSRDALVQALADYSGAVILISHDRHLIETSVDRLWLVADATVRPYDGDIADYRRSVLSKRMSGDEPPKPRKTRSGASEDRRRSAARRREEIAPLRRALAATEARIEELQAEIRVLDRKLADTSLYERHPDEAAALSRSRARAAQSLADAEESWLSLTERHERASATTE